MDNQTRILIADGSEEFRRMFADMVDGEEDLALAGQTGDGEELLRLVRRIGSEVRCYKMPLPQIYREFDSLLGKEFLTLLAKGEIISAFDLVCVDPAVRAVCEPFFERVGRCSAQECELFQNECVAELGRLIEEKKVQVAEKTKVYRSLGLAGGAAAVILLI